MTRLIIIRHCQTEGNKADKIQGYHNDSDFTDEGNKQLEKLVERLKKEKIDAVYCSDLGRTLKVANEISKSHKLTPILREGLRELNPGKLGEIPKDKMFIVWGEYYENEKKKGVPREEIRYYGAENSWDHQKRIKKVLDEIFEKYSDGNVVIVGHAGTNKVIIGTLTGEDPDNFYNVKQDNACINIIEVKDKKVNVVAVNDVEHLR